MLLLAFVGTAGAGRCASGQAVSATLQKADASYRAGQAALAAGNLAAAELDFRQVVQLAPAAEQGHSALGAVLLRRGQARASVRELQAALALSEHDPLARQNLALAYMEVGEPEKALPLFAGLVAEAASQKHALAPELWAGYARALALRGRLPEAASALQSALAETPRDPALHDMLGSVAAQRRDWDAAESQFAEALRLDPGMAAAHLHLALARQAAGQPGALEELQAAARLAPADPSIALALGQALAAAAQDEAAIPLFRQVLAQQPGSAPAALALGLALQRTGDLPAATTLLRQVVAAQPGNAEALTDLGMALSQAQQAKEAVPLLEHAVRLAPGSATAHQDLAAAYVQLNQLDDAVRELDAAIAAAPQSPALHYDLGVALKLQDLPAKAIPELEAAERLDRSAPEPPYVLGMLYLQAGQYADAARELKASLDLRPSNGDAWATLGSVYGKLDRLPEGVAALQEAIRQLPAQPDPHLTLATLLARQGQPAEAAAERKAAAELMRTNMNRQRAEIAANAGDALLKRGDLAGAAAQFGDALHFDPGCAAAHLGLARVLDSQGKAVEAAAEREKATHP